MPLHARTSRNLLVLPWLSIPWLLDFRNKTPDDASNHILAIWTVVIATKVVVRRSELSFSSSLFFSSFLTTSSIFTTHNRTLSSDVACVKKITNLASGVCLVEKKDGMRMYILSDDRMEFSPFCSVFWPATKRAACLSPSAVLSTFVVLTVFFSCSLSLCRPVSSPSVDPSRWQARLNGNKNIEGIARRPCLLLSRELWRRLSSTVGSFSFSSLPHSQSTSTRPAHGRLLSPLDLSSTFLSPLPTFSFFRRRFYNAPFRKFSLPLSNNILCAALLHSD